jgi:hypothetical protein
MEGWSKVPTTPSGSPGASPELLPSGEQPTRAVEQTPSFMRMIFSAKEAAKQKAAQARAPIAAPKAQASAPHPSPRQPTEAVTRPPFGKVVALAGVAVAAGAIAFVATRHPPQATLPPVVAPTAPAAEPAAAEPVAPESTDSLKKAIVASHKRGKGPHRIAAVTVVSAAEAPSAAKSSGALPHKVKGESALPPAQRSAAPSASSAPAAPAAQAPAAAPAHIAPAPPDEVQSATPMTEEERKREAMGEADAANVRWVVEQHLSQIHACYERSFKAESPGGRVEIGFVVNSAGRAVRVRTEVNTTDSDLLPKCIEARISEWSFPRPVSGDFELIYPFVFPASPK